ncbi:hypothetical protein Y032_0098g3135 [Ancylostoma ceylanicum]|uniref:Uncharacterized protein n=1 Tax=Ancylostoma ceylanicum TaxID=53326 RepID=A0A016TJC5_9BILA|nr:hypothetical protein Y032_0098g3135 [Ancylostoma ceylanicum]
MLALVSLPKNAAPRSYRLSAAVWSSQFTMSPKQDAPFGVSRVKVLALALTKGLGLAQIFFGTPSSQDRTSSL